MKIGIALNPSGEAENSVVDLIDRAARARATGIERIWLGQPFSVEPLPLASAIGAAVPHTHVGTSVVTITARHPLLVGAQARIAQAVTQGRFTLGLGLGAHRLDATLFGERDPGRVDKLVEYLQIVDQIRTSGLVDFEGVHYQTHLGTQLITGGDSFRTLVAAMGPRSLQVVGAYADGTLPNLAGPRALGDFIVPTVSKAAEDAGRPAPDVVAAVTVAVTDKPESVLATATEALSFYQTIPSYRAILEREGADHPVEVALIGSESQVRAGLQRLRDAGATEIIATQTNLGGPDSQAATWDLIAALSQEG